MAASSIASNRLIALRCERCKVNEIRAIDFASSITEIYNMVHIQPRPFKATCSTDMAGTNPCSLYDIDNTMLFGQLVGFANIKAIQFHYTADDDVEDKCEQDSDTTAAANAFDLLMSGEKVFPKKKSECHNRKDELYNDVVEDMVYRNLKLHRSTVDDEGGYVTQVITNTLWYLTNQHTTIRLDSARFSKGPIPVPSAFDKFQGYNNYKRKKLKSQPLDKLQCESHSNALYSMCCRAVFNSTPEWREFKTVVLALAECLCLYKVHLEKKLVDQNLRQNATNPPRTVGADISVEFRKKVPFVNEKCKLFDEKVSQSECLTAILFDENLYLSEPFDNASQKFRFFSNLHLSVPIDLFTYCPDGSVSIIVFVAKVPEKRSETDLQTQPIRIVSEVRDKLPEYHTRAQKRLFKQKMNLISAIKPSIVDFMYKELTMDASAATHPVTQQRLQLISLGEAGLVADLRQLNPGRPGDTFNTFFEKLQEIVEGITACDERRHGEAHLSHWISLNDLIQETAGKCPDGAPIPSKTLVRLQFTPRNAYTHTALNFTSRIPVQYKIQKRQLRVNHPDQHYCAAQFKYMKSKTVELGADAILLCCDDKAKVPIGDPGVPVSTGVRGKKTLAPVSETLVACDHDMTRSSLCPSVYLQCATPKDVSQSFVNGQVHVVVNDAVLQPSTPFRHAAVICKILQSDDTSPKVFLRFSDGGTDQRNTLESVKCASICIFKECNFDMMILVRCAPGHSWVNPAERVMSLLNLGLQNCALEREQDEDMFKSTNSMTAIRESIEKHPERKRVWESSINPVQKVIEGRFQRLKLKEEPFHTMNPVSEVDVDLLKRHLRELFPELDLNKLQKVHTSKVESYQTWMSKHCRQRHYTFQIRKCDDPNCCIPPTVQDLAWLPDPVLDGDHFKPYDDVKGQETTEADRPTFRKAPAPTSVKRKKADQPKSNLKSKTALPKASDIGGGDVAHASGSVTASIYTAQNARFTIECCECRKPRTIYSKNKLTDRQMMQYACHISEQDYTCGAYITNPTDKLHGTIHVRLGICCSDIIELSYYSSGLGRNDVCCYCGAVDATLSEDLKRKFKTVLPICNDCSLSGFEPICQRPFGIIGK